MAMAKIVPTVNKLSWLLLSTSGMTMSTPSTTAAMTVMPIRTSGNRRSSRGIGRTSRVADHVDAPESSARELLP